MEEDIVEVQNTEEDVSTKDKLRKKHSKRMIKSSQEKIKVNFQGFNFGLISTSMLIFTMALIFQALFFAIQYYQQPRAQLVSNLLKVYILGSDVWSSYFSMHSYFLEAVLFNNTIPCWGNMKSLDCFHNMKSYILGDMMDNITLATTYELNNFTSNFSDSLLSVKLFFVIF